MSPMILKILFGLVKVLFKNNTIKNKKDFILNMLIEYKQYCSYLINCAVSSVNVIISIHKLVCD